MAQIATNVKPFIFHNRAMITSIGKFFMSVVIGLSAIFGGHHTSIVQPVAISSESASTTTTQNLPASTTIASTVVVNKTATPSKSVQGNIFQKLLSVIAPTPIKSTAVQTAVPSVAAQVVPASTLPSGDCYPDLFVTPSSETISVPSTETFSVKIIDVCGFKDISFRMNTGDSATEVDGIPQGSIDSSGTTATFTTKVTADSTHIGKWPINFSANDKSQTVILNVGEDPAKIAAEQQAETAAEAVAVTVNITAQPASVPFDGMSTISWIANNAASCTLNSSPVLLAPTGSQTTGALETTTTYTINCTGINGSTSGSTTVTIQPYVPPTGYKLLPAGQCTELTSPCVTGPGVGTMCDKNGCSYGG
jgi:hypothetical protein